MVADWAPVNLFGILVGSSFGGVSGSAIIMESDLMRSEAFEWFWGCNLL